MRGMLVVLLLAVVSMGGQSSALRANTSSPRAPQLMTVQLDWSILT